MIKIENDAEFIDNYLTEITNETIKTNTNYQIEPQIPTAQELEDYKLKCQIKDEILKEKSNILDLNLEIKHYTRYKFIQSCSLFSMNTLMIFYHGLSIYRSNSYLSSIGARFAFISGIFALLFSAGKILLDLDCDISRRISKKINYISIPMKIDDILEDIGIIVEEISEKEKQLDNIKLPDYLEYK